MVPDEQVVEVVEFETVDPALRGEMTIAISLADAAGGTELLAVHDRLPPSLAPADNEAGWRPPPLSSGDSLLFSLQRHNV